MITFTKPSGRRVLWSLAAVVVTCCILAGVAVCIGFIVNHEGPEPISTGETVRLAIMCLTLWGPMYLVIAWPLSVPFMAAVTALVACARTGGKDDAEVAEVNRPEAQ
ncbi:hypothetical protein [Mycobacterium sp. 141]|uniref:hypothetical protein n=1 Tax=Mycobacterium sp. 141 TaxID=1120797 RepID=UPI00037EFDA9|nr:hypothetical protein [Mycobacterium sp. 141]